MPRNGRPPRKGPAFSEFNSFQQAMLLWEETHPYNAVHALRLAGPADVPALRRVIAHQCRQAGIGELEIDRENRRYRYLELKDVPLAELPPGNRPEETLARIINDGMNARFPDEPAHPLRWSVFDEADRSAHHIVVAYRHIAADATGLEALLARVLRQYRDGDEASADALLTPIPSPDGSRRAAEGRPGFGISRFVRGVTFYFRFRHMHKMPDERDMGDETAVAIRTLPEATFKDVSAACKALGAGLNDACLAALASAIGERTPHRRDRRHRHKMALGVVASTRKRAPAGIEGQFSVHLSDSVIFLNSPDAPLDRLLPQVTAQTRRLKADPDPRKAASAMQSFFIGRIWPLLDIPNHRRSYRKLLPLCGGVSTFVVDAARFGAAAGLTRYLRACPPGPAIPLVLAPTVCAGRLELSLVYRLSCLPPAKAEDLLDGICERLILLAQKAG